MAVQIPSYGRYINYSYHNRQKIGTKTYTLTDIVNFNKKRQLVPEG
jgi:hypothetical protein